MENTKSYTLDDLLYLMARLRGPEGCPWDLQQSFNTIVPHTLEEVYEVIDTIEREDWGHLQDELGDLLFQVIFYARLAEENQLFNFHEIIHQLVAKLVRRHPHVFPDGQLYAVNDADLEVTQVNQQWEKIKEQERVERDRLSAMDEIPIALPALNRAVKLQKRAANLGFDWPEISGVLDKIEEEIAELREAIALGQQQSIQDEVGDLIFAQVNLCRHLKVDPEQALRGTNRKFEQRFRQVEQQVFAGRGRFEDYRLDELDQFWELAKKGEVQ
ncbi:MAG: nucleoside triphosphate pyrophosphohydrolase [Nitrincola sp.]|nr:nucleoside triphosphate pyrophosphohydrolase [Nitrincola sp.]